MKRRPPHNTEPSPTEGQVLTTVDGVTTWFGVAVVLLDHGASVPSTGVPVPAIILEKAV